MVSRFFYKKKKKERNHYVDVVVADKTGPTFRLFSVFCLKKTLMDVCLCVCLCAQNV